LNSERTIQSALVTGAAGTIGTALLNYLIRNHIRTTALVHAGSERNADLPRDACLTLVECDMDGYDSLVLPERYDAFFHLAWMGTYGDARNDVSLQSRNVEGTLAAVRLAARSGCRVFAGAGSQAEYKKTDAILGPDSEILPDTEYGRAKYRAGRMSAELCRELHLDQVWTRFFSVYGPGDSGRTMVMSGIRAMLAGEVPKYTEGRQMWDYLYSGDAARAMFLAASRGTDQAVYCVGSGKARPLADYIEMIRRAVSPDARVEIGAIPYYPNQRMYLQADISTLTEDTGFVPEVPFEEGIRRTVAWAREHP
jgi:UDP-glucose 4-epimerase